MDKQALLSEVLSKLGQLGIIFETGQGADITIRREFLDAGWSTGSRKITYEASVFADENAGIVYMWERTAEKGAGISFGADSEATVQTGTTLFRKVKSVQYGPDGKAYEISLDLGAIPKAVRQAAAAQGWKFKTVLRREKAAYPAGYAARSAPPPVYRAPEQGKQSSALCLHCGKPIAAGERFCRSCGSPAPGTLQGSGEKQKAAPAVPSAPAPSPTEAKTPDTPRRFGKLVVILFCILAAVVIGFFWMMQVSVIGWFLALVILAALYYLSGKLSHRGCLPLIALWLAAVVALFFVFVFAPYDASREEKTPAPAVSASADTAAGA